MSDTKKQLSVVDNFKIIAQTKYQNQINNYFKGDKEKAMKFMSSMIHCLNKTPKLQECSTESLMEAFMNCAEYELYPSSVSGEAYVLPYKGKAQFQLGYQGLITLLYRAGVEEIYSDIVYEKDEFKYESGLNPILVHVPNLWEPRGKILGAYAVAVVNGEKMFRVMNVEQILKYKEFSQSKNSEYSPWNEKSDPDRWMYRKTVIKQLAKTLPKNETLAKAIEKDNQDSIISTIKEKVETSNLQMGNFLQKNNETTIKIKAKESIAETETIDYPADIDEDTGDWPTIQAEE